MTDVFLRIYRGGFAEHIPLPVLMIALFALLVYNALPLLRYLLYRQQVIGRVAELEINVSGNKRSDRIVAEYVVDGSTYYVRSENLYAIPPYNVGYTIPLRVSRRNPAHAMMPCDLHESVKRTVITGFVFLIFVAAIILDAR